METPSNRRLCGLIQTFRIPCLFLLKNETPKVMAIPISIVSDVACPWCYIGKKRLEKALAQFPAGTFSIEWHPFQLDPAIPAEGLPRDAYFIKKFGDPSRLGQIFQQVTTVGAQEGIQFRFDQMPKVVQTLPLHQLLNQAGKEGFQHELEERFFKANFEEGVDLSDLPQVQQILTEFGWSAEKTESIWHDAEIQAQVQSEIQYFQQGGISGVPFFILNNQYGISGAQSSETFVQALQQVLAEQKVTPTTDSNACDVETGIC